MRGGGGGRKRPSYRKRKSETLENREKRKSKSEKRKSKINFLNLGFEGGQTRFLDSELYRQVKRNTDTGDDVIPKTGRMAVFQHDIYHMGVKVTKGTKYTVRFDAFYY